MFDVLCCSSLGCLDFLAAILLIHPIDLYQARGGSAGLGAALAELRLVSYCATCLPSNWMECGIWGCGPGLGPGERL